MRRSELERMLREAGFLLVRSGRHLIYRRDGVTIPLAHSPVVSSRQAKMTLVQIRNSNSAQGARLTRGAR